MYYMGCVKITSLATYAFNAIMPLSRASTRGRYSRIEGVTSQIHLPSLTWERRTRVDASVGFLEDGEEEGDSAKSEMMVASYVQLTAGKEEIL